MFAVGSSAHAQRRAGEPVPSSMQPLAGGELVRYDAFPSRQVDPRTVYVWLPRGYDTSRTRYDVIYAEDGQNLFLPADAYGGKTWGIAEHLQAGIDSGAVRPAIVVGIWNTPRRGQEYAPRAGQDTAALARLARDWGGPVISDRYVRFLAEELKPFIDRHYRTRVDRAHTFLMGSSMGGLISLYALVQRPDVFGGAACLSTHWPMVYPSDPLSTLASDTAQRIAANFLTYVDRHLPSPTTHRFYFDHGGQSLDAYYEPYQRRMDAILRRHGYVPRVNVLSLDFPAETHNETSWRDRVAIPLAFLLRGAARAGSR
jgi:pimeloyl-ACP methyl ester carboxylesterase